MTRPYAGSKPIGQDRADGLGAKHESRITSKNESLQPMTADTPSPSEVVAHLCGMATAIREGRADHMGDDCADKINQAATLIERLSSPRSSTVDEATVEAVARAMANNEAARALADKGGTVRFDDMDAQTQDFWRILARVAIASLPSVAVQPIGEGECASS